MIDLDKEYYYKLDKFLDLKTCESMKNKFFDCLEINKEVMREDVRKGFFSLQDNDIFKKMSEKLLLEFSNLIGKELLYSFSFITYYEPGANLLEHVDRPQGQYAFNVNLWKNTEWPIFLKHPETKEIVRIDQNPGDAFIYKGIEVPHFRPTLKEGNSLQFMLFAVDKNSPFKQFAGDKFAKDDAWMDCEYPNKEEHIKLVKYYGEKFWEGVDINEEYLRNLGL